MELTADYEHEQVIVRHLGKKPSVTSIRQLQHGDTAVLGDGDALWLLHEKYKHVITFSSINNLPSESACRTIVRKRSADEVGISAELPTKLCSSSAASTSIDRHNNDICDEEQDSDTEHVEMVRNSTCYHTYIYVFLCRVVPKANSFLLSIIHLLS